MEIASIFSSPTGPLEAVTHPDPYPYYANMLQERPFYWDEKLGAWIASSAAAVQEVLSNPLAQVRPTAEPVPVALLGTPLGDIFARLVRMNDGNRHQTLKPAIARTLNRIDPAQVFQLGRNAALKLLKPSVSLFPSGDLTGFAFQLPIFVLAGLLGLGDDQLFQISGKVDDFVRGLAATANNSQQLEAGKAAADFLLDAFNALLAEHRPGLPVASPLLDQFTKEAQIAGCTDQTVIIANVIGFLSQTYDATAGLIGNCLVALAQQPDVRSQVFKNNNLLENLVQEVLRFDPPIQNTRRFLSAPTTISGQHLNEGEMVLVVLAAANRDPSANFDPATFDLLREKRLTFSFGAGKHSCPGQPLAGMIARVALEALLLENLIPKRLAGPVAYRPSLNARIPIL